MRMRVVRGQKRDNRPLETRQDIPIERRAIQTKQEESKDEIIVR